MTHAPSSRPGRHWTQSLTLALLAVAALLALAWLYARTKSAYPHYGTVYDTTPAAPALRGTDQQGRPFDLAGLRGQTVAVFFGFTHCPNICPLTLSYLEKAREQLPAAQRGNLRVVFVTLDPQRDTLKQIRPYVQYFGQDITGVRIEEPQLGRTAKAFGVGYSKADVKSAEDYQINHTAATYLIDRDGKLRLLWDYTQLPHVDRVVEDLKQVMS
ncbi:SCO family protein [Deinococcus maricopensis]|uniref:Electron transport protein SCO1/SenC n=1 Tax=Deinococcus maricopensis (strain DSM 21211 / LMG 22137 / NRRL B-23946 / LB-34) TaxID=709986 RepID=E8U9R0_DEIML|nr:SCO family protein [Deinococcus maricopensis]ADV67799.1 electron transport protein SCO1/SenC [Deinococcus maricopensis DSM 21211]